MVWLIFRITISSIIFQTGKMVLVFSQASFEIAKALCSQTPANKACTRRWGFWRDSEQFPTRLIIFPIGRRLAARAGAGNTNR